MDISLIIMGIVAPIIIWRLIFKSPKEQLRLEFPESSKELGEQIVGFIVSQNNCRLEDGWLVVDIEATQHHTVFTVYLRQSDLEGIPFIKLGGNNVVPSPITTVRTMVQTDEGLQHVRLFETEQLKMLYQWYMDITS